MAEPVAAVPTSANGIIPVMAEGVPQPVESQEVAGVVQEVAGTVREVAVAVAPIVENANPDEVPAAAVEAAAAAAAAGAAGAASAASAAGASGAVSAAAASSPNTGGSSDSSPEKTTPPVAAPAVTPAKPDYKAASSVYEFTVKDASGNDFSMEKYKGHVLLIVNIASKCGYTASNNKELTELKEKYESRGLRILAFPCNQFLGQEPGTNEEIACFLAKKKADFGDVFGKCEVNGSNSTPLYKYLKHKLPGTMGNFIKWNYTKFIVDKNGLPVERHGPNVSPSSLIPNIERYL